MPESYHVFRKGLLLVLFALCITAFTPFPFLNEAEQPVPLVFNQVDQQATAENEPANVLEQFSGLITGGMVFRAEMEHRFLDGFTGDETTTTGRVWVGFEQYKVMTRDQHISVNGNTSRVFNLRQDKVIISNYYPEEDDFAPSRLLGSYTDRFDIVRTQTLDNGLTRITLEAIDPFEIITKAELDINPDNLLLVRMFAEDQTDNSFYIDFSDGELLEKTEDVFAIDWPEEAEVIDLRE